MSAVLSLLAIYLAFGIMKTLIGFCLSLVRFILRWIVILGLLYALLYTLV